MSGERLIYLPLGGAGEIGMNAYVYGYGPKGRERLILVDLGVAFPDMDTSPGVDLVLPDISWLAKNINRLEAIFITHAHEDHIGALAHLWPSLRKPIYARTFTATIGRLKFEEAGLPKDAITTVAARPHVIEAGPFKVQFVPVSHSIPESAALIIDTPAGRIIHSGDFKRDATPIVGEGWDDALMQQIAAERPVKALMCDSTNVFSLHEGRSESTLKGPIAELIKSASGMVVATTFASNVARLKTLAEAGHAAGRTVCLLGRAMKRMVSAAEESGVLPQFPRTVTAEEAAEVPRRNLMLIVTGSQGERRAASAQLSRGKYLGLEMKEGDMFLFSSKTIPGNEKEVGRVINAMSAIGVDIVEDSGGKYHVSGHANRPDLEHVHRLFLPDMLLPMHGEHRHLREHVRIAHEAGIAAAVATNGMMMDISGDFPQLAEQIEASRTYLDGSVLVGSMDGVVRDRIRMALNGKVMVTVILDENDQPLGEAWVELMGLPANGKGGRPLAETLEADLTEFLESSGKKILTNDDKMDEALRRIVRQVAMEEIGKKPEVTVVISRLAME
ncbi:MAG: MBL fold hydrolase [Rhodobacterales bacterium RIFCSPHIGHO2_02_FULL_62_130]|nr:MAG: MBL fold hydrolase [Rhodobacterales bacterium RIFCSPHIGHO2_02_FULL_62_130]OHC60447.1 MAG: MBL fold hydrolase [Rhodobacterales bacterium RIFCSPHIGHO2_12_FULL_62_75]HCZ00966.1 MBL fold hydrolase [Rhodobacter sp.]